MSVQLNAAPITARTKGEVKRLRQAGFVPVSIQHRGQETLHLQQEAKPLDEFIRQHGGAALLELTVAPDSQRQTVMVHDVQRDPISLKLVQVTFQSVQGDEPVKAHIPLVFRGEPEAARRHEAVIQHALEMLEVRCLPGRLPDHITVHIETLQVNDVMRVADLPATEQYEILTPADSVLASLLPLNLTADPAPAAPTPAPEAAPAA